MDHATLIKRRAARLWNEEYAARHGRALRGQPGASPLRKMLEDLAEQVCDLTVVEDDALTDTNILGELNREDGLVLLRPGLDPDRANFVIAHEIGHWALDHPLHVVLADTAAQINPNVTPDDLSVERQQRITGLDLSPAALTALRGYNERDAYEMQANAFATELLVPGGELRRLLTEAPRRSVGDLARRFGVADSLVRVGMAQALFTPAAEASSAQSGSGEGASAVAADAETAAAKLALDLDQERAAGCKAPALVVAGPGAGKTRILTTRYARLVAQGVNPHNILALTFANKAAGEMRERLAALVGPEHEASVEVFTFHAFGLQLLQQYGERIGLRLPLRLVTPMDALLLFRRHAARRAYGFLSDLPKALENLRKQLKAVSRAKEENAGPERWAELAEQWRAAHPHADSLPDWATDGLEFYRQYQATLRRHGLLDYGDLQTEAVRLFSVPDLAEEIRTRYQHILVDEFQDINYVSGRLVRELVGDREGVLWVVGDPRQGIYGFRGASPVNLSRFRTDEYYPAARVVALTRNYRSLPDIVTAGASIDMNAVSRDPYLVPRLQATRLDPLGGIGVAVDSVQAPDAMAERRWLAAQIRREQDAGCRLSDIAVLTRMNKHAAQVAEALTAAGIPHRWGGPIEERPVFGVLMSALLLAADDARGVAGLTMLSPGAGLTPDFPLTEQDRRALFGEGRGRWRARRLLRAATAGEVAGLSPTGRDFCGTLLTVAEALSVTARPHHNLCLYLFEHARWLRDLLPERARADHAVAAILATTGQVLDLASGFAAQRDALARSSIGREREDSTESAPKPGAGNGDEEESRDAAPEDAPFETATSTTAFLDYLTAALDSGDLDVPHELPLGGCDAVALLTAHRSKGLEWPVVFVPLCVEGQFPGKERGSDLPIPPDLIVTDGASASEIHEREETCLFYVAVTRAKDRLYLSGADSYGPRTPGAPSRHRVEIERALNCARRLGPAEVDALPELAIPAPATTYPAPLPYEVPEELHEASLTAYQKCPRQFLFAEVYGLRQDGSAFLHFHGAVYKAARDAMGDPAKLREAFAKNWHENGPSASDWQTPLLESAARKMLDDIEHRMAEVQSGAAGGGDAHLAYRQPKALKIDLPGGAGTHAIRFPLDEEVTLPNGKRVYRRHKQGGRLPKNPPDDDRATLYSLFADQEAADGATATATPAEIAFYYPHVGQEMPARIGHKKKSNRREEIITLVRRMKTGDMSPNPGEACARCPYRLICSRTP